MLTDTELRDAALAKLQVELDHLKKTTRGLKGFTPPPSSEWGKALAARSDALQLISQIGAAPPPPPPTGHLLGTHLADEQDWLPQAVSVNPKCQRDGQFFQWRIDWCVQRGVKILGLILDPSRGVSYYLSVVNAHPEITWWELDNEPYFANVDLVAWSVQVRDIARAIKQAHPGHQVIVPVYVQENGGDYLTNGAWSPWMLQMLDAAPDMPNFFDGFGAHCYANPMATAFDAPEWAVVEKVRNQALGRGVDKPFHVTEFGWSVGPGSKQVTEANQATFIQKFVTEARTRSWIGDLYQYSLRSSDAFEQFGLFNTDKSERPAAQVFRGLV